ncbi:MAG: RDD family protein [Actinomycetota bacterium]
MAAEPMGDTTVQPTAYAGFWRRFAAYLLDLIILSAVFAPLFLVFPREQQQTTLSPLTTAISWLYFALMESSARQATVGKMALGIVVTDLDGNRIGFGRATGRYFAKILSALILLIGFIMAAFTQRKQGLHDIIVGTLVVKK